MKNVLFTVIVPVYNVEPYISECLESIIAQTFCNFEVIIIDDGSTDLSGTIGDAYVRRDSRFSIVHQANKGLSEARNTGIRHAQGEYLLFVDGDDAIEKNTLEQFAKIVCNHKVEIVTASAHQWNADGSIKPYTKNLLTHKGIVDGAHYFENAVKQNAVCVCVPFNLYSREYIVKNNLYFMPNIKHEDTLWTPKAFYLATNVVSGGFSFYRYRMRAGSITHSDNKSTQRGAFDILFVCQELHNFTNMLSKGKTKYLRDFIAVLYMSGTYIGRLDREKNSRINRFFPIKHAQRLQQIGKGLIFAFSPTVYCEINSFVKSGGRKKERI